MKKLQNKNSKPEEKNESAEPEEEQIDSKTKGLDDLKYDDAQDEIEKGPLTYEQRL